MIKKLITVLVFVLMLCTSQTFAEVITVRSAEDCENCIYVAGAQDNYPIEFYDEKSGTYKGIIPDMLVDISAATGLDFAYKTDKSVTDADIISSVRAEEKSDFGGKYLEFISYEDGGNIRSFGISFTSLADEDIVGKISTALGEISAERINGIYLSYASEDGKAGYLWFVGAGALLLVTACLTVILLVRLNRMKKKNAVERMTDGETGLGNLQYFKHHFRHTVNDSSRNLYYIAYIVLDISYLRSYHGDSSFDEVLRFTSSVLSDNTGEDEISARISENGFAVALQAENDAEAEKRFEKLMEQLNGFEGVNGKSGKLVFHGAVYHLAMTDKNCEILLFNLRKNCNKILGTDKQLVFCDVHSMNKIREEKKNTERILKGFEKNEFRMYLQFIVDNKDKKIVLAEALSRWETPENGVVGPGKYIGSMEKAGLISKHDFYMFELACRQLEKWQGTELEEIALSCNFTRITLSEEDFIDNLCTIANKYSFDRSKLAIEITEDAIEKDLETATGNVMRCKELGFKVYLDDLGSGYTSLSNLCDYPIDVVKIDREILLKTDTSKGRELFEGIMALAHSMNMKVVCEGVETEEQNTLVTVTDCDFIQGWYYSKAIPEEEYEPFIAAYDKKALKCESSVG